MEIEEYEIVQQTIRPIEREVKDFLKSKSLSEETVKEYQKIFNRISECPSQDFIAYAIKNTLEPSTFYKYRSAFQTVLAMNIENMIFGFNEEPNERIFKWIQEAYDYFQTFGRPLSDLGVEPDVNQWRSEKWLATQPCRYPRKEIQEKRRTDKIKRKTKGKKHSICGLVSNWQMDVYDHLDDIDKMPFLVLALTGCRPAELGKISVTLNEENGHITFEIEGKKFDNPRKKGQECRWITFDPQDNLMAHIIATDLKNKGIIQAVFQIKAKVGKRGKVRNGELTEAKLVQQYCDRVRYIIQKKMGLKKVSPYSVRHQAASDFKKYIPDARDVSVALGHRSIRMKDHYGQERYAGGGHGVVNVEGTEKEQVDVSKANEFDEDKIKIAKKRRVQMPSGRRM